MAGYDHMPLASPTSNSIDIIPLSASFPAQLQMGTMDPFDNDLNFKGGNMLYVQEKNPSVIYRPVILPIPLPLFGRTCS